MGITIYIDNLRADCDPDCSVSINIDAGSITDSQSSGSFYSKSIVLPASLSNRKIFQDSEQILSVTKFNSDLHRARIEKDGCVLLSGVAILLEASASTGYESGFYRIAIIGTSKEWITSAASKKLSQLKIDYKATVSGETIARSWSSDECVKFLPVNRDPGESPEQLFRTGRLLSGADYHPFLHLRTLINHIFHEAGFAVLSDFMSGDFFDSLYISGSYQEISSRTATEKFNFRAGRFADVTATADKRGRVYCDSLFEENSVGYLVDTADPFEKSNGSAIDDVFDQGGCFVKERGVIKFVPPRQVTTAFKYFLSYTTEYYIMDRYELAGFNKLFLNDGQERSYVLPNRFTDRRGSIRPLKKYLLIVFDHVEGRAYQLRYNQVTNPDADLTDLQYDDYITKTHETFKTRTCEINIADASSIADAELWVWESGYLDFVSYAGDWALYDSHITERGETDVKIEAVSSEGIYTSSSPALFNTIYLGGAEPGMKLTLKKETRLVPLFTNYPAEGSNVNFATVAAHNFSCLDLIKAVRQLFNLYFYTDPVSRTVKIEPENIFKNDQVIDWSEKIDIEKPVVISEPEQKSAKQVIFSYQSGDYAVGKWNTTNRQTFSEWAYNNPSPHTQLSRQHHTNELFTASISGKGMLPEASSAKVIYAGVHADRESNLENINFPCKIVSYVGMRLLDVGQKWGWPGHGLTYPMVCFHDPEIKRLGQTAVNGVSLCFEDRDEVEGLHRFWSDALTSSEQSKRIEVYLNLSPKDIEAIVIPNRLGENLRAFFRLTINGENAIYRLEKIVDYNAAVPQSTKCIFSRKM